VNDNNAIICLCKKYRNLPPMTRSQERTAFTQLRILENIKRPHKKILHIQDLILRSNVRFVATIVLEYDQRNKMLPVDDLMSEGMIGLMEAMKRFNPLRNFKFITYAVWWIRNTITSGIMQAHTITPSQPFIDKIRKMEKKKNKLEQSLGRYLTTSESFDVSEIHDGLIEAYIAHIMPIASLETVLFSDNGQNKKLGDAIPDNNIALRDEELIEQERTLDVRNVIDSIENLRERFIVKSYHGIDAPAMVLEDIGKLLNLTRERVRQLYWIAMRKMSQDPTLQSHKKDSYY